VNFFATTYSKELATYSKLGSDDQLRMLQLMLVNRLLLKARVEQRGNHPGALGARVRNQPASVARDAAHTCTTLFLNHICQQSALTRDKYSARAPVYCSDARLQIVVTYVLKASADEEAATAI
jgi:hypothetical protein